MFRYKSIGLMLFAALMLALCSCGQGAGSVQTVHQSERDNIEEVTLVSIDDSLPPLHNGTFLWMLGDTMIMQDLHATDWLFHAFDVRQNRHLGYFGKFGAGPGEVSNFGGQFFDIRNKKFYGLNGNSRIIVRLDIDSALADPAYKAVNVIDTKPMHGERYERLYNFNFINDSLLICSVHVPCNGIEEFHLGHINPKTGEKRIIDNLGHQSTGNSNVMTVSPENNLIALFGIAFDRLRLFDLDGNHLKTITGPDYQAEYNNETFYYLNSTTGGGKLFGLYLNQIPVEEITHTDIIIFDTEGNYLKTLRLKGRAFGLAYNESTGRLYVSCDGDPQFGYIQID